MILLVYNWAQILGVWHSWAFVEMTKNRRNGRPEERGQEGSVENPKC